MSPTKAKMSPAPEVMIAVANIGSRTFIHKDIRLEPTSKFLKVPLAIGQRWLKGYPDEVISSDDPKANTVGVVQENATLKKELSILVAQLEALKANKAAE